MDLDLDERDVCRRRENDVVALICLGSGWRGLTGEYGRLTGAADCS